METFGLFLVSKGPTFDWSGDFFGFFRVFEKRPILFFLDSRKSGVFRPILRSLLGSRWLGHGFFKNWLSVRSLLMAKSLDRTLVEDFGPKKSVKREQFMVDFARVTDCLEG